MIRELDSNFNIVLGDCLVNGIKSDKDQTQLFVLMWYKEQCMLLKW